VARLSQTAGGVRVALASRGLPPGEKGVHIHAVGACQGPDFTTAGSHLNPDGKKHGLQSPEGPHAGDIPNLIVGAAGDGTLDYVNPRVTLEAGKPTSLLREGGTSLVVHAKADDGKTDPAGDSGPRIACGVIVRP
jgi:Cu-Zn family superoxide dismutase